MKSKLIKAKEILVRYIETIEYDIDAIEYLIDTIDYLLQGRIPFTQEVIDILLEEVLIVSTYHKSTELLDVVSIFTNISKELSCIKSEL